MPTYRPDADLPSPAWVWELLGLDRIHAAASAAG